MSILRRNRKILSAVTSGENENTIVPPGSEVIQPPPPSNKFDFTSFNTEADKLNKENQDLKDSYSDINLTTAIDNANLNKPTGNVMASGNTNIPKYQIPEMVDVKKLEKDKEENYQKELDKSYSTSDYGLINVEHEEKRQTQKNIKAENEKYPNTFQAQEARHETEERLKRIKEGEQRQKDEALSNMVHTGLDAAGTVPLIGNIADLANAGLYGLEGDKENMGFALGAAIPGLGLGATIGKYANKGYKGLKNFKNTFKSIDKGAGLKPLNTPIKQLKPKPDLDQYNQPRNFKKDVDDFTTHPATYNRQESFDAVRNKADDLDEFMKMNPGWSTNPKNFKHLGTRSIDPNTGIGRPMIEFNTPAGNQTFYKSSGMGNKAGSAGSWVPFEGYQDLPNQKDWFMKGTSKGVYKGENMGTKWHYNDKGEEISTSLRQQLNDKGISSMDALRSGDLKLSNAGFDFNYTNNPDSFIHNVASQLKDLSKDIPFNPFQSQK